MLYKKDPNMSYTDMAIYFDKHHNDSDPDIQNKCFECLWHLFYINAVKRAMFKKYSDYEDYAFYAASWLYERYRKEGEPDSKYKPIKSCLNYIKKIVYPKKVEFSQSTFDQVFREEYMRVPLDGIEEQQLSLAKETNSDIPRADFQFYLETIVATVKNCLRASPYASDKKTMHNIYLSCLLTFLKMTTFSNEDKEKIMKDTKGKIDIDDLREKEFQTNVVLYHLPLSMFNYIATMYNVMRREVIGDLNYIMRDFELPDDITRDLLTENLPKGKADAT